MQRISGTETLNFNLFQDASRTIPWGSVNDPTLGNPPLVVLLVPILGTGLGTRTIYARVFGGQTGITPGTYQSSFAGAETNIRFGVLSGLVDCTGSLTGLGQSTTAPFTVQATVDDDCALSVTQNVDFGTVGFLDSAVNGVGEIEVTCTNTTPYTVGLTRQAGALPLGSWEMVNGAETVTYGLYTDVNRTDLWGAAPSDHVSGTGHGNTQTLDVYGRVPAQTTPPTGTYTDTVVVTVTY
jgi:spore coat protein U-like protein